MHFPIHTQESAPTGSKPLLEKSVKNFGYIPNLHAVFASSPSALEAYQTLHQLFLSTSLDAEEKTVVWQTINVENQCHYCVPAHTAIANMMKVDSDLTQALRDKVAMPTEKLQVLHETTLSLLRNRGRVSADELERFTAQGYTETHLLEILVGIAQKTLSNYSNHLAETPLDDAFKPLAWTPEAKRNQETA